MLGSISPFGERARQQRWWITFGAYAFGSVGAGIGLGAAVGAAGRWVMEATGGRGGPALAMLVAAILIGAAFDLGLGGLRLPATHRQVNEDWLHRYRGWVYGVGFGLQLGLGVVTIVSTSAVYVTWLAAFLSGSIAAGAAMGGLFGLLRASALLGVSRVRRIDQLHRVEGRLRTWEGPAGRVAVAIQACLVAAAVLVLAR